ncbi:uptake hydrogenase large subunit [Salmonella enterica subsp. diarizonae]|uniref:Uptake hydrogenase large subunit n=1 Tax=Salmonella diarizonae TaxID=59204 RepID=A0A379TZW1_SALDZ|nr:uptake hydrogenase large subunit [Salmonella enterica subsp. diarizonae]
MNMERLNLVSSIIKKSSPVLRTGLSSGRLADCQLLQRLGKNRRRVIEHESAAYGEFPDNPNDYSASNLLLPRGAIINGRFDEIHPVDLTAPDEIQEFVTHSWYTYVTAIMIRACIRGMV